MVDPQVVQAAFALAWDWSFDGKSSVAAPDLLEDAVYRGRDEGIGANREEADFAFGLEDLNDMARVRCRSRVSFCRAEAVLRGWRGGDEQAVR